MAHISNTSAPCSNTAPALQSALPSAVTVLIALIQSAVQSSQRSFNQQHSPHSVPSNCSKVLTALLPSAAQSSSQRSFKQPHSPRSTPSNSTVLRVPSISSNQPHPSPHQPVLRSNGTDSSSKHNPSSSKLTSTTAT